ncbi:MAG: MBOAT family O-acyltransferase [Eubacteriales bacterium]|nr:MBOAT family O-acyltransferase [Eubacteriales bacterium]
MVFSSLRFVLVFLPIFFIIYYLVPSKYRNFILLTGSLVFYFIGTIGYPEHFIIFILSMLLDFAVGIMIEEHPKHKKRFLIAGVVMHLISLMTFKYLDFAIGELGRFIPAFNISLNIVLPIGISFYTFQGISYIADVYKGKVKAERDLLRYTVYISMFEQLIAGPIVTYSEVRRELYRRKIKIQTVKSGIGIFIFGLGLKVLLANPISKLWTQAVTIGFDSLSTPLAWMSIAAYSFHIYFDFFGYSLMAIGLGKMMGFNLPKNFNHPYTSVTMTEFWRRWHMTLGSWFREYVYIPLGGNRKGNFATIRNLFVVWLLTGLWHGAGYNFLLWGFTLFLIIVCEKYFLGNFFDRNRALGHIYMMLLIPLSWSIFAITDISQLGIFLSRLFPFFGETGGTVYEYDYIKYFKMYYPFFIAGFILSTRLPYRQLMKIKDKKIVVNLLLFVILAGSIYCMYKGFDDPFLYFRF